MIYWQLISPILWIFIIEFNINAAGKYSMNAVELSDFYYSTADEEKKNCWQDLFACMPALKHLFCVEHELCKFKDFFWVCGMKNVMKAIHRENV